MDKHHEHFSAEPALPLWTIEVTLDHTVMVVGIIDSGCQVIIIRKDMGKTGNANETQASYVHGVG